MSASNQARRGPFAKGNILHIVHSQLTWLHPSPPSSLHVASPSAEQRVSPPPLSSSRAAMHGVHWLCLPPIVALELLWCARSLPGSVSNCRSMCRHWRGGRRRPNPPGSNGVVAPLMSHPLSGIHSSAWTAPVCFVSVQTTGAVAVTAVSPVSRPSSLITTIVLSPLPIASQPRCPGGVSGGFAIQASEQTPVDRFVCVCARRFSTLLLLRGSFS
jgi:hypothetical protein